MSNVVRKTDLRILSPNFEPQKIMNMEIINIETQTFEAMMSRFERFAERVEALCRSNGDKTLQQWLDNQDVCQMCNISKRTLQTLRDNGALPHTRIEHKMYYRPADIERLLPLIADRQKEKSLKRIGG
jgi:carbamoylphosphate synthase small subunit